MGRKVLEQLSFLKRVMVKLVQISKHEEGDYEQQSEWSEIDQNEQDELRLTGLLYPYYP